MLAIHKSAATAAADPPDEPPGVKSSSLFLDFHGLTAGPYIEVSLDDPMANSSIFNLPSIIAFSFHSFAVTVLSYSGTKFCNILEAACVLWFFVQKISLIAIGIPQSLPLFSDFIILSQYSAFEIARSDDLRQNALSFSLFCIFFK